MAVLGELIVIYYDVSKSYVVVVDELVKYLVNILEKEKEIIADADKFKRMKQALEIHGKTLWTTERCNCPEPTRHPMRYLQLSKEQIETVIQNQ